MSQSFEQMRKQCEFVTAMIHEAANQLQNGHLIDIKQVEFEAEKMIAQVKKAPPETAQMIAPFVAELISALDEMARGIEDHKIQLQNNQGRQ